MYKSLLHLLIILNILFALFILGGGLFDPKYATFNIYILIPLIYLLNISPYDPLISCQYYIADKCINYYPENKHLTPDELIKNQSKIYIFPNIQDKISNLYQDTFNPVNYQGILVLGYIINIYLLKYKWNQL